MATSQVETVGASADKAKVAVALALVLAGFGAYFILSSQSSYIRWGVLLAAVFAGLGLFFKIVIGPDFQGSNNSSDSLLVKSQGSEQTISTLTSVDDIEYQEYIENRYANYVLEGELRYSE